MNSLLFRQFVANGRVRVNNACRAQTKKMSGGHGHNTEPTVPVFHDRLGRGILIVTFLWIFYRAKENNGKIFGFNQPWHEAHEDHEHISYENVNITHDAMPVLKEEEEHGDHDEHEDEHEEEEEE